MRATEETCRTTCEETEVYSKYKEIIQEVKGGTQQNWTQKRNFST
jgi:hypothetical protein